MGAYAQLLALVEREHELVVAGAWEDLALLDARRREVLAALPARPPRSAAEALRRATALQACTNALLSAGVADLQAELGTLSQGRAAVRGYGGAPAAPAPRLDLAG